MARITFLSRMTVKAGAEARFERIVKDMQARVHRDEPGFIFYEFFKLREPRRYAVLESFPDEATEHAHMGGKILAELGPGIVDCLDGTWEREYLDAIP
jgi:(4S)-4-hydroxy-5-phosphonooxypentane-2,3-dione isomerase